MLKESGGGFGEKEIAPLVNEAGETDTFPKQILRQMGKICFLCPRYLEELVVAEVGNYRNYHG